MNYRFLLLTTLIALLFDASNAQIAIDDSKSIVDLVKSLEGPGVKISNITYHVSTVDETIKPYAAFTDNNKATGLNKGILLATGTAKNALGPNLQHGKSKDYLDGTHDADLFGQAGYAIRDLCSVEFDIVTSADILTFKYIFASEEYIEYAGTEKNDVFAFYISGPGMPKKNLAIVPGTANTPVSINTICPFNPSIFTIYPTPQNQAYYRTPSPAENLEYDGRTVVLTAETPIMRCQTYHIKLAIADVHDGVWDSGVFIESFTSVEINAPVLKVEYEHPNFDYAIEGCNKARLFFIRSEDVDDAIKLRYELTIGGTAVNDIDYVHLPDSVIIPSNVDTVWYDFDFIRDGIPESEEKVFIGIEGTCPSFPYITSIEFPVRNNFPYEMRGDHICKSSSVQLNKNPDPLYSYEWNSSPFLSCTSCSSPVASPDTTTYFPYTITDIQSGCTVTDSVLLKIQDVKADFSYTLEKCYTSLDLFFVNKSSDAFVYTWDFGDGATSPEVSPSHQYEYTNRQESIHYNVNLIARSITPACSDDTTITIVISEPLYIPNLITPNLDTKNDFFEIKGIGQECWTLIIYNRWGSVVYHKDNYSSEFNGKDLGEGVYFYHLQNSMKDREYKGWFEIIDKEIR